LWQLFLDETLRHYKQVWLKVFVMMFSVLMLCISGMLSAITAAASTQLPSRSTIRPAFEVASIKPNKSVADPSQKRLMLQSLLSERFKLAIHHEPRQRPVYALTVTKPGSLPQLHPHIDEPRRKPDEKYFLKSRFPSVRDGRLFSPNRFVFPAICRWIPASRRCGLD
jgi:hypothetical protein